MVKSVKAKLATELKKYTLVAPTLPDDCTSIFYGMVLLQRLPKHLSTFGEISDYLLHKLLSSTHKVVFFFTDRYVENSTKSMERQKKALQELSAMKLGGETKQNQILAPSWKQNKFSKILARRLED